MDQLDKALKQLEFLLKKQPDNATYNNDLGYIWADHDMKLPEAEKLIRKALDLERQERKKKPGLKPDEDHDNAAYLDSLGWVLFKLKNYPEAKKYLLEAVKDKDGQHIEILDHLGDVYVALGEKAEAVNIWKKALTLETKTRREKERKGQVEKKLKANQ
jgi:tetratricopeptide (TPR) repeat protein